MEPIGEVPWYDKVQGNDFKFVFLNYGHKVLLPRTIDPFSSYWDCERADFYSNKVKLWN